MRTVVLLLIGLAACGEPACPIGGLPPCDDEAFLAVNDSLPGVGPLNGDAVVTAVGADSLTVELSDGSGTVVTLPLPGPIDLRAGDAVMLQTTPGAPGVEILVAGRLVGYVGRTTYHMAQEEWTEEAGSLVVELEPVCIRDTGSRSWCDSGDAATYLVYAARIGAVTVPPGETRTGLIGTRTAIVRNRGINAQLNCEDRCIPLREGQFGLDIAIQP